VASVIFPANNSDKTKPKLPLLVELDRLAGLGSAGRTGGNSEEADFLLNVPGDPSPGAGDIFRFESFEAETVAIVDIDVKC
jgi:hypothetical protein